MLHLHLAFIFLYTHLLFISVFSLSLQRFMYSPIVPLRGNSCFSLLWGNGRRGEKKGEFGNLGMKFRVEVGEIGRGREQKNM